MEYNNWKIREQSSTDGAIDKEMLVNIQRAITKRLHPRNIKIKYVLLGAVRGVYS
jgi:hypothetical protein